MKKCGLSVRYFLFVQFIFFFFFAQPEKSKQCAGEHFCNIVREHLSTNEKRRSQLCFRNDVRGDVYTLNRPSTHRNPSTTTHAKKNEQHMKRESLRKKKPPNILSMSERQFPLMYKIHCHFSTHLEKPQKPQQKRTIKTMYAFCYTERHSV